MHPVFTPLLVVRLSLLAVAGALVGCGTPVPSKEHLILPPAAFKAAHGWVNASDPGTVGEAWWRLFNDPVLDDLQAQVRVGNQNLKVAAAQVQLANAALRASRGALWPSVGVNAARSRSVSAGGDPTDSVSLGTSASWEIDVWGKVAGTVSATQARADASAADLAAARLSVSATLAQTYFALRTAEAQAALLERSVAGYTRSLQLTQNRYSAGVVAATDVQQATTQLKTASAQLLDANANRTVLENALATLLGQPVASFALARSATVPHVPSVPVQLPSQLLQRRPDIAAALKRVRAAQSQLGVARSAFFPALTLSANAGYRDSAWADLISAPHLAWSIGPSLAYALMDGGARQAARDSAQASLDQATASYRQTALAAMQEVEDNLVLAATLEQEALLFDEALQAAKRTLEIVSNQYTAGTVSYLNVVTAQATALSAERTLLEVSQRRLSAATQLLKNLGGNWELPSGK